MIPTRPRIAIVGGGFSGTAMAVQLVRAAASALDVDVIEPRATVGPGVAYGTRDPDHRINAGAGTHMLDPADADALTRWCAATGLEARDRELRAGNGQLYPRRGDFGAFLAEAFERHRQSATGSRLRHVRARATGLASPDGVWVVATDAGETVVADLVVIATGNGGPRLPWPLDAVRGHAALVADPFAPDRLAAVAGDDAVLVVGSGLTALDALSTLLRGGHRGAITVVSRHGLRPRSAPPAGAVTTSAQLFARIAGDPPPEVADALTARALLRGTRRRIAAAAAQGRDWYGPFDEVRDVAWKLWPRLPVAEKRRFLRWVRPVYEAHRFRAPPQNDALVREAEGRGQVAFTRGRLAAAEAAGRGLRVAWTAPDGATHAETFGAVVNCTGLDPSCGADDNPFLASLLASGVFSRDPCGVGFAVDARCRPVGRDGRALPGLRLVGPPTAGTWGDPLGTLFIAPQVARVVAGILEELGLGKPACTQRVGT